MASNININLSDNAVKTIVGGACFLGFCYLLYKLFEPNSDNRIELPAEASDFAKLPTVSPESFKQIGYHRGVKAKALPSFNAGDFCGAVRSAAVAFYDVVRHKSGIDADATNLIQKAFRGENPKLRLQISAPAHVTNVDDGLIQMMEGFSKSIRKVHMHAEIDISQEQALQEINIACYLAEQVERSEVISGN